MSGGSQVLLSGHLAQHCESADMHHQSSSSRAVSGLVGRAIQYVIENEPADGRFGKKQGEKWIFLGSKDGDLRDLAAVKAIYDYHKPTHVIHLAAMVGGLFKNMAHNASFLRQNMIINDHVLETSHQFKVKKLVSCLSTCVFPDKIEYPLTEQKVHLGPPHNSNYGYSHAKRLVDVQNRAYADEFDDHFTSVIPTNIFGQWDNYDLEDSHVIPGLVHKCMIAKNLAKLMIWVLREYDDIDPVILSPDENEEISIKQVADAIVKAVGFKGKYSFDTSKSDGQFRKPASNAKLLSKIGSFEFTTFERALQESVQWLEENYSIARTGVTNGNA